MRRLLAASLLCASCAPPAPPPAPPAPPPPPPATSVAPAPSASAGAAPEAPSRPAVELGAPIDGRLVEVVRCPNGLYQQVHLYRVGKGLLGLCGFALEATAVFHLGEAGPPRLAPEVFKDLPVPETERVGLERIEGPDLDHLSVWATTLLTRTGSSQRYRKDGGRWHKAGGYAFAGGDYCATPCPEIGGREIEERPDERGALRFRYRDGRPGWTPAPARAPGCDTDIGAFITLRVRGRDLWGVGNACGKLASQRWTIGGTDTEVQVLDAPAATPKPELRSGNVPTELLGQWFYQDPETNVLLRFDGARWGSLGKLDRQCGTTGYAQLFAVKDRVWASCSARLFTVDEWRLVEVPVPDGGVTSHHVAPSGELRILTAKGAYAFGADGAWHPVILPAAAPAGERGLWTVGGRWVFEAREEGTTHVYVEGASGPPVVVTKPGPVLSPMARVTPLRAGCAQPFAMIYKLSRVAPADYGFPATRAALAGEPELAAGRFHEVAAFGDRYLVARYDGPRGPEKLSRLAQVLRAKVQGSAPQLLCADEVPGGLPVSREVPMR